MGLLLTLLIGGILGWLSSIVLRATSAPGVLLNVILGMLGGLLGAFFLGSLIGGGNLLDAAINPMTMVVALAGAVILLGIVHFSRGRRPRD